MDLKKLQVHFLVEQDPFKRDSVEIAVIDPTAKLSGVKVSESLNYR